MKDQRWAWFQRALNRLERLPFVETIPLRARSQVILGSLISALVLLLVGAFFGARNRGLVGAIVGALSGAILGLVLGLLIGRVYARRLSTPEGSGKLEIQLDQVNCRYLLGDIVSGQVRLLSFIPLRSKGGKIALTCQGVFSHAPVQESGQGAKLERETSQIYMLETDVIPPGELRRGSSQGFAFHLSLPQLGLPTHHGYLCIIRWTLQAFLRLENDQPLEVSQELLIESQPVAMPPENEIRQTLYSSLTELSIVLPRAVYAEGETVSGHVYLRPCEQFKARKMQIVLLRVENTLQGDNRTVYIAEWDAEKGVFRAQRTPGGEGTTYVWLEGEADLCGEVTFRPTEPASYPFAVEIMREWRPTIQAEQGSTTWKLGVTLECEGEPEQHVFQELFIHTCVPKVSQLTMSI